MRVLVIANEDIGGYFYQLTAAARRAQVAYARLLTLQPHAKAQFPTDLAQIYDGGAEVKTLLRQADVLHLVDTLPNEISLFGEPLAAHLDGSRPARLVLHFTGKLTVRKRRQVSELLAAGATCLVSKPGLLPREQAEFVLPWIPLHQPPWLPLAEGTRPRMNAKFAPFAFVSSLQPLNHQPALEARVERVHGECLRCPPMHVESLSGREHVRVLARRRYASVTVTHEEPHIGLSLSALESCVQGVPVLADLNEDMREIYCEVAGGVDLPLVAEERLAKLFVQALERKEQLGLPFRQWALQAFEPGRLMDRYTHAWQRATLQLAA